MDQKQLKHIEHFFVHEFDITVFVFMILVAFLAIISSKLPLFEILMIKYGVSVFFFHLILFGIILSSPIIITETTMYLGLKCNWKLCTYLHKRGLLYQLNQLLKKEKNLLHICSTNASEKEKFKRTLSNTQEEIKTIKDRIRNLQ